MVILYRHFFRYLSNLTEGQREKNGLFIRETVLLHCVALLS